MNTEQGKSHKSSSPRSIALSQRAVPSATSTRAAAEDVAATGENHPAKPTAVATIMKRSATIWCAVNPADRCKMGLFERRKANTSAP